MRARVTPVVPEPIAIQLVLDFASRAVMHRRADTIQQAAVGSGIEPQPDLLVIMDRGEEVCMIGYHRINGFENRSLFNARYADVAGATENTEGNQQPPHDANYDDDIEDLFDLPVHGDVGIHQPEQHADDDEGDSDGD